MGSRNIGGDKHIGTSPHGLHISFIASTAEMLRSRRHGYLLPAGRKRCMWDLFKSKR